MPQYLSQINATTIPTLFPPAKIASFAILLNVLIPIIFSGAALVFLVMMLYAGFNLVRAQGDPEKFKKTQEIMKYSVVGLVVVIASYLAVKLLAIILKVDTKVPL
ncbi:hypothetical protein HYW87_00105 [Candidatus Roizmanbacteria bacterium]|nr:hypothetical protein [Candidatus Roizmanbacteria bacterium]